MRELATRLIACEEWSGESAEPQAPARFEACEKLRLHLGALMGSVGFAAVLSRALALAGAEVSWLRSVQVKADGSLEGWGSLEGKVDSADIAEGRVVLLAHLLGLLVAFIGENLTLRLAREIWPELSVNHLEADAGR